MKNRARTAPRKKLIKLPEVVALTDMSPSTIYKYMGLGQFPRSVKVGSHAVRWHLDEVERYITTRPRSRSRRPRRQQ